MSMADRDGKIWLDGEMVDWRDAKIHVTAETTRCYGCARSRSVRARKTEQAQQFSVCRNTQRLFNSARSCA